MEVQNAGLGEGNLRDLNDEINKLVREKRHWEIRIRDLGGRDYTKMTSSEPGEDTYSHGIVYRYYGAAKNLPGIFSSFFCLFGKSVSVSSCSRSSSSFAFIKQELKNYWQVETLNKERESKSKSSKEHEQSFTVDLIAIITDSETTRTASWRF